MKVKNIINKTMCVGVSVVGAGICMNPSSVYAFGNDNAGTNNGMIDTGNSYLVNNEKENAFHGAGLNNSSLADEIFDVKDSSGEYITEDKIESIQQSGGNINIKLEYKDSEVGNTLADLFGNDTVALQHYINYSGSSNITELSGNVSELVSLKNQIVDLQNKISGNSSGGSSGGGQTGIIFNPDGTISLIGGSSSVNGSVNPANVELLNQLQDLLNQWKNMTGMDGLNCLTPDQINIVLAQIEGMADASLVLTPATKTYYGLNRVVISVTNSSGGTVSMSPVQSKTEELLYQHSGTIMNKYRSITGKSSPTLTAIGGGQFELNFMNDIKNTPNYVNHLMNTWVSADDGLYGFMPCAAFTSPTSGDTYTIKLTVYVDKYIYKEKISTGIYPTGKSGDGNIITETYTGKKLQTSIKSNYEENYYTWEQRNDSYFYSDNITGIDTLTGKINRGGISKTVNKANSIKSEIKTIWEIINDQKVGKEQTEWSFSSNGVKYPNKGSYVNGNKNRPLISTNDGPYVRNIWFKAQQIRYWDYKEEPMNGSEVYGNEPWVVTKYNDSELSQRDGEKYLVSFPSADKQKYGYVLTKERASYRLPDASRVPGEGYVENRPLRTYQWKMAPLSGEIQVPVISQQGSVSGVISGADIQIDTK